MNRHVAMLAMLLCLFVKGAAQSLDVGTGSLSITAGVESTIIFGDGTKLVITGSADADVTISPEITGTITKATLEHVDLPTDFSLFRVGVYSGLNITLSAGSITTATFTTSPDSRRAAESIADGMQVACLRFNAEARTYTYITSVYNNDKTVTVDLPKVGFYTFVSAPATASLPTIYAEARVTSSSEVKTISYAGGELTLRVQTTNDNKITCTKKSISATMAPSGKTSIDAFFDIELEEEEEIKKGEIKYKYDSDAVAAAGAIEASLRFMFKSDQGIWTVPDGGSTIDVSAKVVTATTKHFSEWGVFGDVIISITANTDHAPFELADGTKLVIKGTADAEVIISPKIIVNVDLPADFSLFTVGAYSGFDFMLSAGTIIKATLNTSYADANAVAMIKTDMQVACLRFDAEANIYTYIDGVKYNTDKTMRVDLPKAGFYTFVSASATVPIPTIYAEARATSSTEVKTISYAGGELILRLHTTTDNKITCTKKSSSTTMTPAGKMSIGAFFDIELEKEEEVKKGEIKYKYDAVVVAATGASEASLHFMFKSEAGIWTALSGDNSKVDVSAKVVIATTTHFSEWGVFGISPESSATRAVGTSADSSASSLTGSRRVLASLLALCFVIISR